MHNDIEIRQIFYDEITEQGISEPLIPFDNSNGRKDWFEFWPILNFLINNTLKEDKFYGFLSPRFASKTGLSGSYIWEFLVKKNDFDVLLVSYSWDHLSYFLSPWEQGDIFHYNLIEEAQKFLKQVEINVSLRKLISTQKNAVFSNFVVANKKYWDEWKDIAIKFLMYADNPNNSLFDKTVPYQGRQVPMKVFIQERLPTLILNQSGFKITNINLAKDKLVTSGIFVESHENKNKIKECGLIKQNILDNGLSKSTIMDYAEARKSVDLSPKVLSLPNFANRVKNFSVEKFLTS